MRLLIAGSILSALSLGAYAAGVFVTYPGRAFSLAALMAGLTVAAIGRREGRT